AHAEHHRGVGHDGCRIEAAFEGGGVDEGLEARARLAARLRRAVELLPGEAEAADQRPQRAVVGLQRDQRRLRARQLVQLPRRPGVCRWWLAVLALGLDAAHAREVAALEERGRVAPGPTARS